MYLNKPTGKSRCYSFIFMKHFPLIICNRNESDSLIEYFTEIHRHAAIKRYVYVETI